MIQITREIAAKVLETIDAGLVHGVGKPIPGKMCVEAAVCYALGLPHGDNPEECVAPSLRRLKIALNDERSWLNADSRAAGMRRLGLVQLGSWGVLDDLEFEGRVTRMVIGKILPMALRSVGTRPSDKAELAEKLAALCEAEPTLASVRMTWSSSACWISHYTKTAAWLIIKYIESNCVYATQLVHAVDAAACAIAGDYHSAKREEVLAFFAEEVVQILVGMEVPGCQWLDLAPLN